ncbi:MAG TPA: twin-arginine translocase subunit TatC [candidate division Zixibacteria bacterium]|nr:twin-arginine translocase subunit TatC [candidate division Zixibacteria bacterium]
MSLDTLSDMPFLDHLEELRIRLIKSISAVLVFAIAAFVFSEQIMGFMSGPVEKVYFMAPTEAFMVQIKISLLVGVLAAAPVLIYQLWMFILPGLYEKEVKIVFPIVIASTIFFYGGGAFCLFYVIPIALKFLMKFGGDNLEPLISVSEYFVFVTRMVLAFAIVFELPVVSYFLGRVGILSSRMLGKGRRYAVVIILVLSAVLTPPDIFSQMALGVPLYLLYELSILIVYLTGKREKHRYDKDDSEKPERDKDPYAG